MIRVLRGDGFLPSYTNLTTQLFQKLNKQKKRLEVVNDSPFRKFYKHLGDEMHEQLTVLEAAMANNLKTMHRDPMQVHPGSSKTLQAFRQQFYSPNFAQQVQPFANNCQNRIKTKLSAKHKLKPPLPRIFDTCDGPTDIMEINLVGELPNSNGFTHIPTATDVLSRFLFSVPLKKPDCSSVVRALMQIFTQHAYVPRHILTDKGSAFTSQVFKELMDASGILIDHDTVKHEQTIDMVERSHQWSIQVLKINVDFDSPQLDRYVNFTFMTHNTMYRQAIECSPIEIFHGHDHYNDLDLKITNPIRAPYAKPDITTLIDQINEKYKVTVKNIYKAFQKYKRYNDRESQTEPLKNGDFTFLLNPDCNI